MKALVVLFFCVFTTAAFAQAPAAPTRTSAILKNASTGEEMKITEDEFGWDVLLRDTAGELQTYSISREEYEREGGFREESVQKSRWAYALTKRTKDSIFLIPLFVPIVVTETVTYPISLIHDLFVKGRLNLLSKKIQQTFEKKIDLQVSAGVFKKLKKGIEEASLDSEFFNAARITRVPPTKSPFGGNSVNCNVSADGREIATLSFVIQNAGKQHLFEAQRSSGVGFFFEEDADSFDEKKEKFLLAISNRNGRSFGILDFDVKTRRAEKSFVQSPVSGLREGAETKVACEIEP